MSTFSSLTPRIDRMSQNSLGERVSYGIDSFLCFEARFSGEALGQQ